MEREVVAIEQAVRDGSWQPGGYREFFVREPKVRMISAAPFRDRVVHHALVLVLEPFFERFFISDSYACRAGKGIHRAVKRYREWSRHARYFLKMDVEKFFASIDHAILLAALERHMKDRRMLDLAHRIVDGSNPQEPVLHDFPGDDLFTPEERRHGLPIGNQTSQFLLNVYLDPLDQYVKRRLGVRRYLRYVDDLVVVSDSKAELHELRQRLEEFACTLCLRFNPRKCFLAPVEEGVRLLGYRVYPDCVRLVSDGVVRAHRRLRRLSRWLAAGRTTFDHVRASAPLRPQPPGFWRSSLPESAALRDSLPVQPTNEACLSGSCTRVRPMSLLPPSAALEGCSLARPRQVNVTCA